MTTQLSRTIIAASLALMGMAAFAQTTGSGTSTQTGGTQSAPTASTSSAQSSTTAADRIITQFTSFAGSQENATSLVNGLRTGSEITLGTTTGSSGATSASFTPPTKPMGYGNVRIALSLAEAQLAAEGITQPTPEQLQTALMGSTSTAGTTTQTTQTQGVLQMRASGMGWGQIANQLGFKLGAVMSGRVPATAGATAAQTSAGSATTTASGTSASAGAKGGSGRSSGIVTATGASVGGQARGNHGAASAAGNASGITTGLGNGGGAGSGAVTAQGGSRGQGNASAHGK